MDPYEKGVRISFNKIKRGEGDRDEKTLGKLIT